MGFQALLAKSQKHIGEEMIVPVISSRVFVKLDVVYRVRVNRVVRGWSVYRLDASDRATYVRPATNDEIWQYTRTAPHHQVIVAHQLDSTTWLDGNGTPIYLCAAGIEAFDSLIVAEVGASNLFTAINYGLNAATAQQMRDALAARAKTLSVKDMTPEHHLAYAFALEYQKVITPTLEEKLRAQLEFSGARYISHAELENNIFRLEFEVDGHRHTATVGENLVGRSWGFCLSGRDNDFDVTAIPHVIRERDNRNGYDYDDD